MNAFRVIDYARRVERWAIGRIVAQIDGLQAAIGALGVRLQALEDKLLQYQRGGTK